MIIYKNTFITNKSKYDEKIILEFYTNWCITSTKMNIILNKLYNSYKNNLVFYRINIDENNNITTKFNIKHIPTLIYFKNSTEISRLIGLNTLKTVNTFLNNAKNN